jgi:DNA-binding NtrC family response regulator/tetratricopeptide (TPR) repeat protein
VPNYDRNRIAQLEEKLAVVPGLRAEAALADLEMLADLYMQADSYVPALETIEHLLSLPAARTLSIERRAVLESKVISCRLARGDGQGALAHCRELLTGGAVVNGAPQIHARLRLQCAEALFRLARLEDAREESNRALALADEAGDLSLSALALNTLGRVLYRQGDLQEARDLYEQALALFRRLGDDANTAYVRNNLGLIQKNLCEWDAAIANLTAALELHRRIGRFPATGNTLANLGIVYQKSGDWERALDCYRQAEQVFAQMSDSLQLAKVGIAMGNIARLQRRFDEAEALLGQALDRARSSGGTREEVLALEFLGELAFDREHPEMALDLYREALTLGERVAPEGDLVVELERRRAEALCMVGRLEEASRAADRARRLARQTDDRLEYAITHRAAGTIALAQGRRAEALQSFVTAVHLLSECRERYELGRTLLQLARAVPDPREGRRHLYRASALFAELSAKHWLDLADQELDRLATAQPGQTPAAPASLLGRRHRAPSLVACSTAMQRVESLACRGAATELSVLITGETGTGKELIARTIHGLSSRVAQPFLAVNCGALRADLALSQLFGHRKGAFTGAHAEGIGLVEAAHGGTLVLDEAGELPPDVQVTMLRFLESGEYLRLGETKVRRADVRLIAATNRELRSGEGERLFRRDLLFRLNEIEIRVPALRERTEDVVPLARHFLAFYGGIGGPRLSGDAESVLVSYGWPGNVRELENVMKRVAALHAGGHVVDASALLPFLTHPAPAGSESGVGERDGDAERKAIAIAYEKAHGNKSRVAEMLGVSRKTLYARIKRLQIVLP